MGMEVMEQWRNGFGKNKKHHWKPLLKHRTKEVEQLRERAAYYKSQLDEARLMETQTELSRHRGQETSMASETLRNCIKKVQFESSAGPANVSGNSAQSRFQYKPQLFGEDSIKSSGDDHRNEGRSASFLYKHRDSSRGKYHSKPQLVIPSVNPSMFHSMPMIDSGNKSGNSGAFLTASIATQINSDGKQNGGKACKTSLEQESMESQPKGTKRKNEQKEDKDLILLIGSTVSSQRFHCQAVLFYLVNTKEG